MKSKKTVFLARITKEDKQEFYDMCDMQARNASEVLRRMMAKFCNEMRAKEKRERDDDDKCVIVVENIR